MKTPQAEDFLNEAQAIHQALFRAVCPERISREYVSAHSVFRDQIHPGEQDYVRYLVARNADLLSVEYALRFSDKQNLLTKKFRILSYLTEVDPGYEHSFRNANQNPPLAWIRLVALVTLSAYRLAKGMLAHSFFKAVFKSA